MTIAKRMKEQGLPVNIGMLIEYYIAEISGNKKRALVRERAKMPEEMIAGTASKNAVGHYDIDYYLKNQILPAVENIFEVFDVDFDELLDGERQKGLGEF